MVSVIIPSHNTAALLAECIESLPADAEVIVADNASTDGTVAMLRQRFPRVQIVELPENRGYGAACNAGARLATGEFLLFLNSDTRVEPGTLDVIAAAFRADPQIGAVACHELTMDGQTVLSCCSHHTLRSGISFLSGYRLFRREGARYRIADWDRESDRWVDNVSGFAWAIRREVFARVGEFDEKLFLYFEEQDYALRLRQMRFRIKYLAAARIRHHGAASSRALGRWRLRRHWVRSFVYLRQRHGLSRSRWLDYAVLYPALGLWWAGYQITRRLR